PELGKQRLEGRGVARADLEGRAQRPADLLPIADIDADEGREGVDLVAGGDADAGGAQGAGEAGQVIHHGLRQEAFASSTSRPSSAPSSRRSRRSLTTQPSVASTVARSRWSRWSRASARAQSMLSATPGLRTSFCARSACTNRAISSASVALAPGT